MIDPLLHALAGSNFPLSAEELADTIWLASFMDASMGPAADVATPYPTSQQLPKDDEPVASKPQPDKAKPAQAASESSVNPQAEVHLPKPGADEQQRVDGVRGVAFRSPAATALPGKLELARALRPIIRKIPSSTQLELDEIATAEQAAEEVRIAPKLRPAPERWLDVAVVIDDWHTMALWQQTVAEFLELLQQLGAFRTLHTYLLHTYIDEDETESTLELYTTKGASFRRGRQCRPGELLDPTGRRLLLVLTDCTSPVWSSGAAGRLLSQWGAHNFVTLVQMLPADLWHSCALADAIEIAVSAPSPTLRNSNLTVERPWYWDDIWNANDAAIVLSAPVPVVTLEPESLRRWSHITVGKGGSTVAGFYIPMEPTEIAEQPGQDDSDILSPEERWQRFRATASPIAQELAGYLSAAPLSLPVMRLVQRVMLPQSRQVHLAEILRSGLIYDSKRYNDKIHSDAEQYDFAKGIRKLLLTTILVHDTLTILDRVSAYLSKHSHQLRTFHALLIDPLSQGKFQLDEASLPFANVAVEVLHRIGGPYAALAIKLRMALTQKVASDDQRNIIRPTRDSHTLYKFCVSSDLVERTEGFRQLSIYLFPVARRMLKENYDLAQDCVQEALVAIWRKLMAGNGPHSPDSFLAFAIQLTRQCCIDRMRYEQRTTDLLYNEGNDIQHNAAVFTASELSPEFFVQFTETKIFLIQLIQAHPKLSQNAKTVLIEGYMFDKTDAELAQLLSTSEANIRLVRYRALHQLRNDDMILKELQDYLKF